MSYLERWNSMTPLAAADAVLPCCGSRAWAAALAGRRPLSTLPELLAASDAAWWSLPDAEWKEAFDSHPRIGEKKPQGDATAQSEVWSATEQTLVEQCEETAKRLLAEGNRAYEERFGRIFIVCATGKTTDEMLRILEARMSNTPEAELHEAAEQQRQITHLRLQKWLAEAEQKEA